MLPSQHPYSKKQRLQQVSFERYGDGNWEPGRKVVPMPQRTESETPTGSIVWTFLASSVIILCAYLHSTEWGRAIPPLLYVICITIVFTAACAAILYYAQVRTLHESQSYRVDQDKWRSMRPPEVTNPRGYTRAKGRSSVIRSM